MVDSSHMFNGYADIIQGRQLLLSSYIFVYAFIIFCVNHIALHM